MSGRLTAAQRQEKADIAVGLSAKGWSNQKIAEELDVNRNTAGKLIKDELANRAEHRDNSKEKAIAVYEAVIAAAWQRFKNTGNMSLNSSGFLNTIKAAQDSINKVTGAEAPRQLRFQHRHEPSRTEQEAAELADEIAALEAELADEAEALGAEEGGA